MLFTVSCPGMPGEQFYHGLEFRNMSVFVAGTLRAGTVSPLEKFGPQRQRKQLPSRHGTGPRPFQHTHGVGARISGLAVPGRVVRHDLLVLFHERKESRDQSHFELG